MNSRGEGREADPPEWYKTILGWISDTTKGIGAKISSALSSIRGWVGRAISYIGRGAVSLSRGITSYVRGGISWVGTQARGVIGRGLRWVHDTGRCIGHGIVNVFRAVRDTFIDFVRRTREETERRIEESKRYIRRQFLDLSSLLLRIIARIKGYMSEVLKGLAIIIIEAASFVAEAIFSVMEMFAGLIWEKLAEALEIEE